IALLDGVRKRGWRKAGGQFHLGLGGFLCVGGSRGRDVRRLGVDGPGIGGGRRGFRQLGRNNHIRRLVGVDAGIGVVDRFFEQRGVIGVPGRRHHLVGCGLVGRDFVHGGGGILCRLL